VFFSFAKIPAWYPPPSFVRAPRGGHMPQQGCLCKGGGGWAVSWSPPPPLAQTPLGDFRRLTDNPNGGVPLAPRPRGFLPGPLARRPQAPAGGRRHHRGPRLSASDQIEDLFSISRMLYYHVFGGPMEKSIKLYLQFHLHLLRFTKRINYCNILSQEDCLGVYPSI